MRACKGAAPAPAAALNELSSDLGGVSPSAFMCLLSIARSGVITPAASAGLELASWLSSRLGRAEAVMSFSNSAMPTSAQTQARCLRNKACMHLTACKCWLLTAESIAAASA